MEKDKSFGEILNDVIEKNFNRTIMGQLNINSIGNKSHFLESKASKHLDILLISEANIDESFPLVQLQTRPLQKWQRDTLYVRDDISFCLLREYKLQDNTECLLIEINIRNKKWLYCCS